MFCVLCILLYFARIDGFLCLMCLHLVCLVYCVLCYMLPVLLLWFVVYMLMVSSVRVVCIWCVLVSVYLFCLNRLVDLVYFVSVDGFVCSIRVHLVCFVYCVCCFVLLVLLVWFLLYTLMVSSVQCVFIWCALFMLSSVLFCPSCCFSFFCIC